jgi:hypothetical protein
MSDPHFYPYPPFASRPPDIYEEPITTFPGGTLLHKGFYDLLAMIPTPSSPSRLIWGPPRVETVLAGPRYEDIPPAGKSPRDPVAAVSPPVSLRKDRRISKDMVSKPTGFLYVSTT